MEDVYSILRKEFGLKEKHIIIMKALEGRRLRADKLCKATDIPQGRIYEYLNDLVEFGVVEKEGKKPATYTISDIKKNMVWFTKQRIDSMLHAQAEIMDTLKQQKRDAVEFVDGAYKFTQTHMHMLGESKKFKYMSVHGSFPYVFYPSGVNDFIKVREIVSHSRRTMLHSGSGTALLIYRAYMDALKAGKSISVLCEKEAFDFHMALFRKWLGRQRFRKVIQDVIKNFENLNVEAHVIDEYNPMQIDVNERQVCLSINYIGITNGILISSKQAVNFMNQVFDERVNRAKNVIQLLKKELKK
jgi:predicted transcriptional regulator